MGKSLVGVVSPIGIELLHCIGGRQTISTNPVLKEGVLAEPVGFLTEIFDSYISLQLDCNEFNFTHIKQKFEATGS